MSAIAARISGWYTAGPVVGVLLRAMALAGLSGSFVEVGVHHGKSFVSTLQHVRPGFLEPSVALDVFDDQSKNLDKSGKGSYGIFATHLQAAKSALALGDGAVRVFQQSSLELTPGDVLNATGGKRAVLFSVDACHNYDCTLNDLHLAYQSLHPRGLILLDDYVGGRACRPGCIASWPRSVEPYRWRTA